MVVSEKTNDFPKKLVHTYKEEHNILRFSSNTTSIEEEEEEEFPSRLDHSYVETPLEDQPRITWTRTESDLNENDITTEFPLKLTHSYKTNWKFPTEKDSVISEPLFQLSTKPTMIRFPDGSLTLHF